MLHQLRETQKGGLSMQTTNGIHTFALKIRCSYSDIQNILSANRCIHAKRDAFGLNNSYAIPTCKAAGVEVLLHQSLAHPSAITLIVNPSSVLAGEYQPVSLFRPTDKALRKLHRRLRAILDALGIEQRLGQFNLSRCDLTRDIYCEDAGERMLRLDYFRKSLVMRSYQPVPFREYGETEEKLRGARTHTWTIRNKGCAFSVYDKTYELRARHGIQTGHSILRTELRLERKTIRKQAGDGAWPEQLAVLSARQGRIWSRFLHRLHQDYDALVTKQEALARIDRSSYRRETRKALRRIVKKADGCQSLAAVQRESRIKKTKFIKMLDRFRQMGFSPLVLPDGFGREQVAWYDKNF